jgi:hypothetical protein
VQDQKRKKIEALRDREAKQDRRAKLEELLVVKLCNKYGRTTDMCGTIASIVSRFMKNLSKITERDLVTLENKVRSAALGGSSGPGMTGRSIMSGQSTSRPVSRGGLGMSQSSMAMTRPASRGGSMSRPVSRGGGGSRPSTSQGTSSLAKLGLNISGKLDTRAEQEGEWMVLATFNKLQYEKEERERTVKLKASQVASKRGLDAQEEERQSVISREKQEKAAYALQQTRELKEWEQREKAKFDKRMAHTREEEVFRKRQVDEQKRLLANQRARKLQEDEIEIGKCKQMIAAEKLQLVKQKERERAKLESIMAENEVCRCV